MAFLFLVLFFSNNLVNLINFQNHNNEINTVNLYTNHDQILQTIKYTDENPELVLTWIHPADWQWVFNKEREILQSIIKLQQKSLGFQKEIQKMENKLKRPILENIRAVINDVSKDAKVDLTFESSTAPVVYAKNEKDLTEKVIKLYNKKYPK